MEEIAKETVSLAKAALGSNDHKAFFEAFGFKVYEEVCIGNVGEPNGIEIETYTDGGEDMVIGIEVDGWQDSFREYVDGFDATESVMTWWREGEDKAHERGVPFANIIEHYEDYMGWIAWLKDIVRVMDGKEPERVASTLKRRSCWRYANGSIGRSTISSPPSSSGTFGAMAFSQTTSCRNSTHMTTTCAVSTASWIGKTKKNSPPM